MSIQQVPRPKQNGISVYGKQGCGYSMHARQLINNLPNAVYHNLNQYYHDPTRFNEDIQHRINGYHTLPVVFVNNRFIGGCQELEQYL